MKRLDKYVMNGFFDNVGANDPGRALDTVEELRMKLGSPLFQNTPDIRAVLEKFPIRCGFLYHARKKNTTIFIKTDRQFWSVTSEGSYNSKRDKVETDKVIDMLLDMSVICDRTTIKNIIKSLEVVTP